MKKQIAIAALAVLALSATAWAQNEPLIGTWKLNVAKSKYDPGPPPRSETMKYEAAGKDTLKRTNSGVDANGQPTSADATIVFDGKEHPVTNSQTVDTTVSRRLDAYTSQMVSTKGGMLVTFTQRFLSPDGKTLTIKVLSIDAQGKPNRYVDVYEKQ